MSIRSIDMMILYSKSSDVEKAQTQEQQAPRVAQEQVASEEIKRKAIEEKKAPETNKDEDLDHIREQPHRKQGNRNRAAKAAADLEEEQETEKKSSPPAPHNGAIDITI